MKKLLLILLVTAVISSVGCAKAPPEITVDNTPLEAPTQIIADINTEQALTLIQDNQDNPDFVILDVRTPAEFDSGHIENAINLDYNSETFSDELNNLDKDKTYLVYCGVGRRSAGARDIMKELNFMTAYNMLGGINQWKQDGLPTTE
jgi:rhodanese-related sulfurtransferase